MIVDDPLKHAASSEAPDESTKLQRSLSANNGFVIWFNTFKLFTLILVVAYNMRFDVTLFVFFGVTRFGLRCPRIQSHKNVLYGEESLRITLEVVARCVTMLGTFISM